MLDNNLKAQLQAYLERLQRAYADPRTDPPAFCRFAC